MQLAKHTSGPAFAVAALTKVYRLEGHSIPVLGGVDLTIERGEWVALVGASGSGKTTLLHLLGALDEPTSGTITCMGIACDCKRPTGGAKRLTGLPARLRAGRRRTVMRRDLLGMVFQSYHLLPELNAWENVLLPGLHASRDKGACRRRARSLLESFGLGHRLRHRPQELSGGEQQRVAIARALINDPPVVLADEPTGNLDQESGEAIVAILEQLRAAGKTVVMVTHDPDLARKADRVLALRDGVVAPLYSSMVAR